MAQLPGSRIVQPVGNFDCERHWDELRFLDSSLLDLLPVAVYFCDAEGVLVRWNRCAVELWGQEPIAGDRNERFCGSYILYRIDGNFMARSDCAMADALRTGLPQHVPEAIIERPDGSRRYFMSTIDPIRDQAGKLIGAVNVLQDITDKKLAESALLHVEKRFRLLLEKLPTAAYTCDPDGLITYFNERAIELWGRAPKLNDPIDRFCGSFKLFALNGTPIKHDQCWMALALKNCAEYEGKEIIIEREDGSFRTALAYATPFFHDSGELEGAVNVLVDITERNQARVRIEQLLDIEQEQTEQLREADRRKDEFLAMLAHELRNPLAPIRSGLDLLALCDPSESEAIELMRSQVDHLVRLVDDLLDVSRIVRGRVELRREPVELSTIVSKAVDAMRLVIKNRDQELVVSIPSESVWLDADAVRLIQVIENLLNNASKYTDKGGRIELIAERREKHAVISVTDDGIGIDAELLPDVFTLFTQATRSLDRSQGGLGIGLTLAKNLVEMHDGSITAHSEGLAKGSRFVVQLPLVQTVGRVETPSAKVEPAEGRRILVVDDNVGAAKILSLLLVRHVGIQEVEIAHDGPAALEKAKQFKPDVMLLDIGLPTMDGLAVARKLRALADFQDVFLVALTGYGQEEDLQKSMAAGFDEHLVKPVGVETLRQLLRHPKLSRQDSNQ